MLRLSLGGPGRFLARSAGVLASTGLTVSTRRVLRGPRVLGWPWLLEVGTRFQRRQMDRAFALPPDQARAYLDSLVLRPEGPRDVRVEPGGTREVRGRWFVPDQARVGRTVLYFHGGGYAYSMRVQDALTAHVARATRARTFALEYRLAPEHPFPAPLEDALAAYRWLLEGGANPERLALAGDSAGGHLVLTSLLALRDRDLILPALGLALCPWTELVRPWPSFERNDPYDILSAATAIGLGRRFLAGEEPSNPLATPMAGDFRDLPPLYLQAGGLEILRDMIVEFAADQRARGADVQLDLWETMNHDFQVYGPFVPESRQALARIASVADRYLG